MASAVAQAAPASRQATASSRFGRIDSIDILRGLAILWVITFHLWADTTYRLFDQPHLFLEPIRGDVLDGRPLAALSAIGEAIVSQGTLGVPAFMMLSGIALTMNAYRRGEPSALKGYVMRFKRILPVYWAGILLGVATLVVIAYLQVRLDGGTFSQQWSNVRIGVLSRVSMGWDDILIGLTVFGWIFREKPSTPSVDSLWFVELLLQFYVLFPLFLRLERKVGPWTFAIGAVLVTTALRGAYMPWGYEVFSRSTSDRNLAVFAPFQLSSFCLGISMGHLLATRREELSEWVSSGFDSFGFVVLGLASLITGLLISPESRAAHAASFPLEHIGLALLMFPLLFKPPGRLEASIPARGLIAIGVVSFTVLIVNDDLRFVGSFLRYEGVPRAVWWFFLWIVYVPVGTLLAYPFARLFGLLPSQRARGRARDAALPAADGVQAQRRRDKRRAAREGRRPKPARV